MDVHHYAVMLSHKRHLDDRMCQVIAYGHDLGRLKDGIVGKGHASASANVMKKLLNTYHANSFTTTQKKIICHAIAVHNQKNTCHGPYDELIKDADSLAHHAEKLALTQSEKWRIQLYEHPKFNITVAPITQWQNSYIDQYKKTNTHLVCASLRQEQPDTWVHQGRTSIRIVRSIAWALGIKVPHLKTVADRLEKARTYHVSLNLLPKDDPYHLILKHKLAKEHKKINLNSPQWLAHKDIPSVDHCRPTIDKISKQALMTYLIIAFHVTLDDHKTLHRLRIQGKRLLSWQTHGLIDITPLPLLEAIQELHHHLGKFRDCMILRQQTHSPSLQSLEKTHRKHVRQRLLYLKLTARQLDR
jgi:hypothetical protein